ncbi:MAG: cation transporter [Actinobacteria bacterium]|nr:cation transporter [Actinomycetota bacterium]
MAGDDTHDIPAAAQPTRSVLLGRAQQLAGFTVAYNLAEGAIAIGAGFAAGSQALVGFGFDSGIESISAAVLLWRIGVERREPERAERVERTAERLIGISFIILGAYVAFEAITDLINSERPDTSVIGLVLTAFSLIVMPLLARRKHRVADALGSNAARADAAQTMACVWLSAVVLIGLALNAALGWWWADPVAALAVVLLLLSEGREALSGDDVDGD